MSEMKKIRMGEASFNYSPETAYEKNGNVYCNTCHEQIDIRHRKLPAVT